MFFIINSFLFSHLYYLIVRNCKNTIIQTVRAICIKLVRLICAINSYLIESTWLETLIVLTLHVAMSTILTSNTPITLSWIQEYIWYIEITFDQSTIYFWKIRIY